MNCYTAQRVTVRGKSPGHTRRVRLHVRQWDAPSQKQLETATSSRTFASVDSSALPATWFGLGRSKNE